MLVLLSLCSVALIVYRPDAEKVNSFISFAATLTSLFLGAVAIFYSMIANQGFTSTLGRLQRSSENIENAAKNISDTSGLLSGQSERLWSELSQLSPAVRGIAEKVDLLSPSRGAAESAQKKAGKSQSIGDLISGSLINMYLIVKSFRENKSIDPHVLFDGSPNWRDYTDGFLDCVYAFSPLGIELSRSKSSSSNGLAYSVASLGSIDPEEVITETKESNIPGVVNTRVVADSYFNPPVSA
jgi:hypothetical protein